MRDLVEKRILEQRRKKIDWLDALAQMGPDRHCSRRVSLSLNGDLSNYCDKSTLFTIDNNRKNRLFEAQGSQSGPWLQLQYLSIFMGYQNDS